MTLRVATTALGNRIYAGRPNKRGDGFLAGRVDVTSDVLKAISEFVGVGNEITVTVNGEPECRISVLPASADTHPKDGDVEQAPLVSGAVPHVDAADAQGPSQ